MAEASGGPTPEEIPFNRPHTVGTELRYITEAVAGSHLSANGPFSKRCAAWLEQRTGCRRALLTHSCTGALEMSVLLAGIEPGDEIIMPSFTFVSTANAFALRGGVPVFVDVRADTLNLDERLVEAAVTSRTKAIVAVHYGGIACDMDALLAIARKHDLILIEDAAHSVLSTYRGRFLGTLGDLGTLSFHETKNVISGEGGALLIRDDALVDRAEILLEKGTNRSAFFRGEVDKYTWVDLGSSFGASEITSAFLWAQLERAEDITRRRLGIWQHYQREFADLEEAGVLRRPIVPDWCRHEGHLYYLLASSRERRDLLLERLGGQGIRAVFHYVPLHSAPAGRRYGRPCGDLGVTEEMSGRLLRLPLWAGMEPAHVDRVVTATRAAVADPASVP